MFSNAIEVSYLDIGHVLFGNWQHPLPFGITVHNPGDSNENRALTCCRTPSKFANRLSNAAAKNGFERSCSAPSIRCCSDV